MLDSVPVFGVCGYSGSGKTTLLEQIVPLLVGRGLHVAVVKHDVHGVVSDPKGKDSDRLFRAGADAIVRGPGEYLVRRRLEDDSQVSDELDRLAERYDLVLLEGFKELACRKVWLLRSGETDPPEDCGPVDAVFSWDSDRAARLDGILTHFLKDAMGKAPVFGCVLIGGGATRMGQPRHLLPCGDDPRRTWLHGTVDVLARSCQQVVLSGSGTVPPDLQALPRIPDPPGLAGPIAGLLGAMRWNPRVGWLLAACDMPCVSDAAVRWLISQRAPGLRAVLLQAADGRSVEPALAWYDSRCRPLLESIGTSNRRSLQEAARHPKIRVARVPAELAGAWLDTDTPEDAASLT